MKSFTLILLILLLTSCSSAPKAIYQNTYDLSGKSVLKDALKAPIKGFKKMVIGKSSISDLKTNFPNIDFEIRKYKDEYFYSYSGVFLNHKFNISFNFFKDTLYSINFNDKRQHDQDLKAWKKLKAKLIQKYGPAYKVTDPKNFPNIDLKNKNWEYSTESIYWLNKSKNHRLLFYVQTKPTPQLNITMSDEALYFKMIRSNTSK